MGLALNMYCSDNASYYPQAYSYGGDPFPSIPANAGFTVFPVGTNPPGSLPSLNKLIAALL